MVRNAPGKFYRKGISLTELIDMFPTEETAREWCEAQRWPDGPYCPRCGSFDVQSNAAHPTMSHRCRRCKKLKYFSVRVGTVMEGSKLGYRVWVIAIFLLATNLKGVSSMKLHRDLGITQKNAWHLLHRIRKALQGDVELLAGPVEIDETFIGGLEANKTPWQEAKSGARHCRQGHCDRSQG